MSAEGQDHPDKRIRDLDTQLGEVTAQRQAIDQEWSASGSHDDLDRYTLHSRRATTAEDKIAVLEAMKSTDPSFKAADVARELSRQREELSRSQEAARRYRPGST